MDYIHNNKSFLCNSTLQNVETYIYVFDTIEDEKSMLNKLNCVVENLKLNDSTCSTYILFGISNKNSYFDYIYSDNICKYIPKTSFNTIRFRITTLSSLNNAYNTINGFLLVFNIIFL